ncbi:MAG TPA: trimethylamine methyltransferase family protein [Acidimicrobiia bacterium]|nr:trimethylamine methyltransferase family protein [Acidimicrobiia bacterium]
MTADEPQRGGRRGRRREGSSPGTPTSPSQPPWQQPVRRFHPVDLVDEEQIETIHQTSLQILSEIGMDFLNEEARRLLEKAGADVDPDSARVRFDPAFVEEKIKTAPSEFTLHARNPERNLHMGGDAVAFTAVSSPPNVSDEAGGRRVGNREDFQNLLRLGHTINMLHMWGGFPVEPVDLHPAVRHLEATYDMLTLSDRVIHAYSLGKERNQDAIEMIKIARQIDDATLEQEPSLISVVNASSPLRYDTPMLQGMIEFSSRNQVIVCTPFTLAGAMAPVTVAGALAQHNAEALAGIAFTQVVRPGAPVIYGGFTSNVDMRSGAPAFGTPEFMQTAMVTGQLTRRYGIPYRSSGVNAANALDAQAAYESVFSLWGAVMGGAHMILHAVGWMEGGLRASFEKMILDADLCAMVARFMDPIDFSEGGLALDAVRDVGPGGHFFGTQHTLERYRDAFYAPLLSDWRNYEAWEEAGRPEAKAKMIELVDKFMASYEEPPMEQAVREELEAYVERRKAEGGVPTDY